MSKTIITLEFPTAEAAHDALTRLTGRDVQMAVLPMPKITLSTGAGSDVQPEKTRKPRSDAGQPRGQNARTTGTPPEQKAGEKVVETPKEVVVATAVEDKTLTVDTCRAAMKRISGTKGLGMDACMKHLADFGVEKISDLKAEKYAEFIAKADEKIAAAK